MNPVSGYQNNRYRYYNSKLGRWMSYDPIRYNGSSNGNLYAYINNAPYQFSDFYGLNDKETLEKTKKWWKNERDLLEEKYKDAQKSGDPGAISYWGDKYSDANMIISNLELSNGSEPDKDLNKWSDGYTVGTTQTTNNCYSYSCNDPDGPTGTRPTHTWNPRTRTWDPGYKPQPGVAGGTPWWTLGPLNCTTISRAAANDGLRPTPCDEKCPCGWHKVALVVDPSGNGNSVNDYHWYVLNSSGTWSHKPGNAPATDVDANGAEIVDPRGASRDYSSVGGCNYSDFCGCFCVPANTKVGK